MLRSRSSTASDGKAPALALGLIAALAAMAYATSFRGQFAFDDEPSLLLNPTIHNLWQAWRPPHLGGITVEGRPLLNFTFAVNYAISGSNPWSYHLFNLLIHATAGMVLFDLVRRTLGQFAIGRPPERAMRIAFFAALLWVLHPLQTEAVTYVVQRAESLVGLLYLLTLWCFVRGAGSPRHVAWFAGATVACLAGMAVKEVMVTAPVIVLLYDRTFLAGTFRGAWRARRAAHGALFATWFLLAALVLANGDRGGTFNLADPRAWWRYDLTQCVALVRYFALTAWPHPLAIDYGTFWISDPLTIAPQALLLGALISTTAVALWRWPAAGFLGAWFFIVLAPSSLPPGTIQMIVEHRMYLPLAAPCVLAVVAVEQSLGRRSIPLLLAAAGALGSTAAQRNTDYTTPIRLFEDTVAKRPGNARASALLGDYYRRAGRLNDARRALERSLAVEPAVAPVLNNLGTVWQELGEPAKAAECFTQALARGPADAATLNNLGNALLLAGRPADAIARLRQAVELQPDSSATRLNLAKALAQQGDLAGADEQFAIVTRAQPDDAETHAMRATLLQQSNRIDDAIAELRTAVRLRPADPLLHDQLGAALGRAGQLREALAEFETALRLNPADENARQNAAVAARRLGLR